MSGINFIRADNGEEYDNNPSHQQFYVDEASLYSIAEDSRENSSSAMASSAMQSSRGGNISRTNSQLPQSTSGTSDVNAIAESPDESPVEVRWVTAEEMAAEQAARETVAVPEADPDLVSPEQVDEDDEEDELGPQHNARRSLLFILLLIGCALVLILSVTLAFRNRKDGRPRATVSGGISDPTPETDRNSGVDATPSTSGSSSTTAPTLAPTDIQDPRQYVWNAVTSCPQTNPDDLTNISTSQMEVFEELVAEVSSLVSYDAQGRVVYDPKVGVDWILEKWAMLNLFFETTGEFWMNNMHWYSYEDTCKWYNQDSSPCVTRSPGGGAVSKLKLASNNLQGELPKELCCMPELTALVLNNNGIEGTPPACLYAMGLAELDLVGNSFTAQMSLESP